MDSIQSLFAPLDKDYCLLFYWLTVVNFIFLAIAGLGFVSALVMLFRGKVTLMSAFYSFLMILVYALVLPESFVLLYVCDRKYEGRFVRRRFRIRLSSCCCSTGIGCFTRGVSVLMLTRELCSLVNTFAEAHGSLVRGGGGKSSHSPGIVGGGGSRSM